MTTLSKRFPDDARCEEPGAARSIRIVEVLGPAGAGKTTILRALHESHVPVDDQVSVPWPDKVLVLGSILGHLLPYYLYDSSNSRLLTVEEVRRMYYVKAWHRVLARLRASTAAVDFLDHGPIFMLGMIQEFGPDIARSEHFKRWSEDAITAWSQVLDAVIWLDAPDAILVERIEMRQRDHCIKGRSIEEATFFLERCRRSFEQILAQMSDSGGLRILRFDTSKMSVQEVVDQLMPAIDMQPGAMKCDTAESGTGYLGV